MLSMYGDFMYWVKQRLHLNANTELFLVWSQYIRGVRKTEIQFGLGYKKILTESEPSKNLTSVQTISDRNCVQSAIQIKSE